ncbi:MAG TPA: hypothetical protein VI542_30955 [Candidatus Tectomicrobia bacterium]
MDTPGPTTPQFEAEVEAFIMQMKARIARNECFQCGTPLTAKRQVGRCIYAEPCGCRQGQGRLVDAQGQRAQRVVVMQKEQD